MKPLPLAVVGSVNIDLILGPAEPWPVPGTEIIVDHDEWRVGGAAGNTALALAGLGLPHTLATNVGSDHLGEWLRKTFGHGADGWTVTPGATTITVGITHPNGERTFFTSRGHLPKVTWQDMRGQLDGARLEGGIVLFCNPFLMGAFEPDYDAFFDWAEDHQIRMALDTGWPPSGWTEEASDNARHWISRSHCVLLNEVEATTLSGLDDPEHAASALHALMPPGAVMVVKLGPQGALAIDASGAVHRTAAPKVDVIDTIGAGDVFNAGFLGGLSRGLDVATALEIGCRVASTAVSTLPRRYGDLNFESMMREFQ